MASKAALKEGSDWDSNHAGELCQHSNSGRTPHGAAEVAAEFAGKVGA